MLQQGTPEPRFNLHSSLVLLKVGIGHAGMGVRIDLHSSLVLLKVVSG